MDPYEYLLSKLNVKLEFPINWTKERIFKVFRNIDSNTSYRQYDKELDFFCRQLSCFPDKLESIEHVDLLLTVNGMNIGA